MIEAYKNYWKQYFDFTGVTSCSGYWWVVLMSVILGILSLLLLSLGLVLVATDSIVLGILGNLVLWAIVLFPFVNIIPSLAILIRRLRDAGYDWPWYFINFVPVVGPIILLVLLSQPTKQPVFVQAQFYQGQMNNFAQGQAQQPFQQATAFTQGQNNQQANVAQPQQAMQPQVGTPEVQSTVSEQASTITSEVS